MANKKKNNNNNNNNEQESVVQTDNKYADDIDAILNEAASSVAAPDDNDGGGNGNGNGSGGSAPESAVVSDIGELKQELEASKDRYLRLMAEFDNYKRRTAKEYERMIQSANEKLILEMVDVRENFERALKAAEQGGDAASISEGMRLIFNKFEETLSRNGLSVFAQPGEPFDPSIHDALMNTPHAEIPADHIAEVFERGYRLKDRVIKHARVIVSGGPAE